MAVDLSPLRDAARQAREAPAVGALMTYGRTQVGAAQASIADRARQEQESVLRTEMQAARDEMARASRTRLVPVPSAEDGTIRNVREQYTPDSPRLRELTARIVAIDDELLRISPTRQAEARQGMIDAGAQPEVVEAYLRGLRAEGDTELAARLRNITPAGSSAPAPARTAEDQRQTAQHTRESSVTLQTLVGHVQQMAESMGRIETALGATP
jgi:hypothetical protein